MMHRLTVVFQVMCSYGAVYFLVKYSDQFISNKDSTSISYTQYNKSPKDMYPTYSMCFEGEPFHWINELEIFRAYSLGRDQYQRMLEGKQASRYEYVETSRLYRKMPTFMNNGSDSEFEKFHVQLSDLLIQLLFATENGHESLSLRKIDPLQLQQAFQIEYQTPDMICFTRQSNDFIGSIRLQDELTFNSSVIKNEVYADTKMSLFVHYPGQLIKSLDSASFSTTFQEYRSNALLEVKLSLAALLRKRPDSNIRCEPTIRYYDGYLQQKISTKYGCVPVYWGKPLPILLNLEECKNPETLDKIYRDITDYKKLLEEYEDPCISMYNAVMYNWQAQENDEISVIKIIYKDKYYEEINYAQEFGIENFFSGVGGFVGIFLGYSLLQIPDMLGKFHQFLSTSYNELNNLLS